MVLCPSRFRWAFVTATLLATARVAIAQGNVDDLGPGAVGGLRAPLPGATTRIPALDGFARISTPGVPTPALTKALTDVAPDSALGSRRGSAVQLYRKVSPSVVLVVTENSIGSGTLLDKSGLILTNWHVVGNNAKVGVIFKPVQEGAQITEKDLRLADVVKVDQVADLALVRVASVPKRVEPVSLGTTDQIAVGADVHAIGHPTGEVWTYTKGVISQIRRSYDWTSEDGLAHSATVIQTQTPINPGNSGGPLLTDDGKLVGVNSFKAQGEGLNFAVAVEEVRRFLKAPSNRIASASKSPAVMAPASTTCESKILYEEERKSDGYEVAGIDVDCDGKVDAEIRLPYDKSKPLLAVFDRNGDGKLDLVVMSYKRNEWWDISFVDTDFDGKFDLVGHHPDGKIEATTFAPYSDWAGRQKK